MSESVSNKNMSLKYCSPKTTTLYMKNAQVDTEMEGLISVATDGDNYGTLWMFDNNGKGIIPKSNLTNGKVLFEGSASSLSETYTLDESLKFYKYLLVVVKTHNDSLNITQLKNDFLSCNDVEFNNSSQFISSSYVSNEHNYFISYQFKSETTFEILTSITTGCSNLRIDKIIGIK